MLFIKRFVPGEEPVRGESLHPLRPEHMNVREHDSYVRIGIEGFGDLYVTRKELSLLAAAVGRFHSLDVEAVRSAISRGIEAAAKAGPPGEGPPSPGPGGGGPC